MEKQKLQIGTEIYCRSYGNLSYFGKVDRVTEKFAMVGTVRFSREYRGRDVTLLAREKWHTTIYFAPDENDIIQLKKQNAVNHLKGYDWAKLSYTELMDIIGILKKRE